VPYCGSRTQTFMATTTSVSSVVAAMKPSRKWWSRTLTSPPTNNSRRTFATSALCWRRTVLRLKCSSCVLRTTRGSRWSCSSRSCATATRFRSSTRSTNSIYVGTDSTTAGPSSRIAGSVYSVVRRTIATPETPHSSPTVRQGRRFLTQFARRTRLPVQRQAHRSVTARRKELSASVSKVLKLPSKTASNARYGKRSGTCRPPAITTIRRNCDNYPECPLGAKKCLKAHHFCSTAKKREFCSCAPGKLNPQLNHRFPPKNAKR
ncbi:Protein Y66D12A.10, partial [Aphelenchoides avenae]